MANFVAVDGEGWTEDASNTHHYFMIASSLGNHALNVEGLSTHDVFRFLIETKKAAGKRGVLVGFAINYDINMWLRDVAKPNLVELWKTNRTEWRCFKLQWLPGKFFQVHDMRYGVTARVYDTFGFFQCSFARALDGWRIPHPEFLVNMKASRSDFTPERIQEILDYCHLECDLLVRLMTALKASLDSVNLPVRQWNGAGAIAASLLARHRVDTYIQPDESYGDVFPHIMAAYYGGRSELFQQGEFPRLYGYDIRSAYPAACLTLPSLVGARFIRDDSITPDRERISLHHVKWSVDLDAYIMPFPYRHKRVIYYPAQGEGYYWSCEVAAAQAIHGAGIKVLESWRLDGPHLEERPLSFVAPIYEERARLKREGHFGHQSYKLAINALYGKLAQGVGFDGKPPRFRTYVWAGWITAYTRARMMELTTPDVVAIATDGIYFTKDPGYECGGGLGELEAGYIDNAFIAQPGIYTGTTDGGVVIKSRGVYKAEVDFEDLRRGYRDEGPYYFTEREGTRFVGLGTVLTLRNFRTWRKWEERTRKISLWPNRKYVADDEARPTRHAPPLVIANGPSEPYDPKRSGVDAPGMVDFIQALEQPMNVDH